MGTLIKENDIIDTPMEMLIVLLMGLIGIIILFKIANFLESLPIIERKTKEKVVKEKKKEVKVEIKKEVKEEVKTKEKVDVDVKSKSGASSTESGHVCPYANCMPPPIIYNGGGYVSSANSNYLYDRFVDNPTYVDSIEEKKISENFLSDKEHKNIIESNVNIKVNDVQEVSNNNTKANLHNRIREMTSSNLETREKLLKEFEGLSREMKLLIIDNIIQKM